MKSHIKAVHRDGGFDMKTWIKCGLRWFVLKFKGEQGSRPLHSTVLFCTVLQKSITFEFIVDVPKQQIFFQLLHFFSYFLS